MSERGSRGQGRVSIGTLLDNFKRHAKAAGHPELVVYDLRRSAIRNMIRAGVHQHVAMRISGHRSATVFRRYNIISADDLAAGLRQTQRYLDNADTSAVSGPVSKGTRP